jgi:hypothetical protein
LNILITAASTAQAHKLSRFVDAREKVFLGDSEDLPGISLGNKLFTKIPPSNSASFSHLLLAICLDLNINQVFPLKKAEVLALAEARQLFDEYGIKVMVPERRIAEDLFSISIKKGEIIIKDTVGEVPDRGVFVIDAETNNLKLFTAD